jgi:hypothetical protein
VSETASAASKAYVCSFRRRSPPICTRRLKTPVSGYCVKRVDAASAFPDLVDHNHDGEDAGSGQ